MAAIALAKSEMSTITMEPLIIHANRFQLPPSTKRHCEPGDQASNYREKDWCGLIKVIRKDVKELIVTDGIRMPEDNITHAYPSAESNYNRDAIRLLSGKSNISKAIYQQYL